MKVIVDHLGGSRVGQRQVLDLGRRLLFGRHPDSDVWFDAHRDLDASSRHAEIVSEGGRFCLRDIGSSNGTFVKGALVTEVDLPPGVPVVVEFGESGPRVRLFVGSIDSAPPVPTRVRDATRAGPGTLTLSEMWRAARQGASEARGLGRSSLFLRSFVHQALHESTLKFKLVAIGLSVLSIALASALLLTHAAQREQLRAELDRERQLLANRERDNAIRMDMVARAQEEGPGARIAAAQGGAVYLLVVDRPSDGGAHGFCTGFAVAPRYLGTNAHCALEAVRLRANGYDVYALHNGDGARVELAEVITHPRYTGGLSEDVGLIGTAVAIGPAVPIADSQSLHEVRQGANLFALGFPGRLAQDVTPEKALQATIVDGIVGRLTDFAGQPGEFEDRLLVQHNLLTSPGTSGSPIFDGRGVAIAINAGSYTESSTEMVVESDTGKNKTLRRSILTPGASYGIRIDALVALMGQNGVDLSAVGEGK